MWQLVESWTLSVSVKNTSDHWIYHEKTPPVWVCILTDVYRNPKLWGMTDQEEKLPWTLFADLHDWSTEVVHSPHSFRESVNFSDLHLHFAAKAWISSIKKKIIITFQLLVLFECSLWISMFYQLKFQSVNNLLE